MNKLLMLFNKQSPEAVEKQLIRHNSYNTIYLIDTRNTRSEREHSYSFQCIIKGGPEMYRCSKCGFKVYLKVNLKIHLELYHKLGFNITLGDFCSVSETNFNLSNILKCHNCEKCGFQTFSLLVMLKHNIKKHHSKRSKYTKTKRSTTPTKQISMAHKPITKTQSRQTLMEHPTHKKEVYDCLQCSWKTKCKYQMKRHLVRRHTTVYDTLTWFACEQCSFKTLYKTNLNKHKLQHLPVIEEEKMFQCEYCAHRSKQKRHLDVHIMAWHTPHDSIKWFGCDHCSYKAKHRSTLKGHVLAKHTAPENIKWIQCHLCSYKSKRPWHLKQHLQGKHTAPEDIKWIQCELCSYKCKRKMHLKRHLKCRHQVTT